MNRNQFRLRERASESMGRSRPLSLALVGWHLLPLLPLLPLFILLLHTRAHTSSLTSPVLIRPGPTPAVMSSAARRKTRGVFGFCRPVLWGRRAESFSSAPHPSIPAHLLSPPLFGEKKKDTLLDSPSGPGCSPPRFLVLWGFYFSFPVSSSGLFFCHWWSRIKKKNLLKNLKKFLPWKVELNLQIRRKVQQNFKLLVFLRPRRLVLDLDVRVKKMSPVQKPRSVL